MDDYEGWNINSWGNYADGSCNGSGSGSGVYHEAIGDYQEFEDERDYGCGVNGLYNGCGYGTDGEVIIIYI